MKDTTKAYPKRYDDNDFSSEGMDLRDWFAGQALNAYLTNHNAIKALIKSHDIPKTIVESCYCYADDMMKERSK